MPFTYKFTTSSNIPGHGISETLYFQRPDDDLTTYLASLQDVTGKRARLLGSGGYIKAVRLQIVEDDTDTEVLRRGQLRKFGPTDLPGSGTNALCEPNVRLQIQMSDSFNKRKKLLYLGGAWAGIFPASEMYDPNFGAWASYFNTWQQAVIALQCGWFGDSANPVKYKIVNTVTNPVTGITSFTLDAPGITWPNDNLPVSISVDFPLTRSPLDGRYLVWHDSATTFHTAQPRPAAPFTVAGNMWIDETEFVSLATLNNQGQTGTIKGQNAMTRKTGRPTYASRGRLAKIVRW